MKIQRDAHRYNLSLATEYDNYKLVQGRVQYLPKVIDYGQDGPWTFLVVEDLGIDLGKVYRACSFGLALFFVAQLISEMVGFFTVCYASPRLSMLVVSSIDRGPSRWIYSCRCETGKFHFRTPECTGLLS
jgi:hypothetical protein